MLKLVLRVFGRWDKDVIDRTSGFGLIVDRRVGGSVFWSGWRGGLGNIDRRN